MKRAVISALILSAGLVMSLPASAQDFASQFVGVWKLVDLTRTEVVSGKVDKPFGEKPTVITSLPRAGISCGRTSMRIARRQRDRR